VRSTATNGIGVDTTVGDGGTAIRATASDTTGVESNVGNNGIAFKATSTTGAGLVSETAGGLAIRATVVGSGVALHARGRVRFSSAGAATILKGQQVRTITSVDVPPGAKILAMLNANPGPGNAVQLVRRVSGTAFNVRC
jgi:hypothetical protein